MADVFSDPHLDDREKARRADLHVEVINEALSGIPAEMVRFHTCYGINEGPRVHDAALGELVGPMLRVNASKYSFEAANCRHEHEYHLWESVKLPDGKAIMPGVITTEVHPTVIWTKFRAMAEGAAIASKKLWPRN